ncbi:hypothetical protein ACFLTP_05730 [Chloroflexota bacterium]
MRRSCIAITDTRCDGCGRIIKHPEPYLIMEDEEGEINKTNTLYYCVDCSLGRNYAHYKEERGQQVLTFFPNYHDANLRSMTQEVDYE